MNVLEHVTGRQVAADVATGILRYSSVGMRRIPEEAPGYRRRPTSLKTQITGVVFVARNQKRHTFQLHRTRRRKYYINLMSSQSDYRPAPPNYFALAGIKPQEMKRSCKYRKRPQNPLFRPLSPRLPFLYFCDRFRGGNAF
ncbi:hypothetical protein Zmor_013775 [Zophobas morio]|uniref:Uncharacterized protein n=1 Tax=Zophobas morio TaxID=2755281 RepID=A0AA38IJI0_9CUCU|nr:hypothetical protein Zmor_013775 [Zophobas morio]